MKYGEMLVPNSTHHHFNLCFCLSLLLVVSSPQQGVLNIETEMGCWVLNKQAPNQQIWWSSPVSGPLRFEYDLEKRTWTNSRGGEQLKDMIHAEVMSKLKK
jgi:frataxin-like iron-binding protein CyaY